MTWQYHVIRSEDKDALNPYGLHEVYYYDEEDEYPGAVMGWTEEPIISGESPEELKEELEYMQKALQEKPFNEKDLYKQSKPLPDFNEEDCVPLEEIKKMWIIEEKKKENVC